MATGPGERIGNYLISLPERLVRSAAGASAGLLRELSDAVLPAPFRRTRLYQNLVETTLRFVIEQVGQVEGAYPANSEKLAEDFALRRTAGNGIELLGIIAFRASPVWVMAALADLSGAGRVLIREIAGELKDQKLLDPESDYSTMDELLAGLEAFSGHTAGAINTPPLDVASLREEWTQFRRHAVALPKPAIESLEAFWLELREEARAQDRSVFVLSSVMALSALRAIPESVQWLSKSAGVAARRTGELVGDAVMDHYRATLDQIHRTGWARYWVNEFRPYLRGAAEQFYPSKTTFTEKVVARVRKGGR